MIEEKKAPTLRFKGFTDKWEQHKLGTLFQKNIERNDNEKFNYNQTLSVSTMTFKPTGNGASAKSLANYKVLRLGDVAFEGHSNKQFSYGRFVVNDNADGIMSPRFATIRPIKAININYWKNYLHNENIMKYVLVKSTKAGTMMNELVYSDLYKQVLKVPNITEQVKIGNLLQKIEIIITLQQQKLNKLDLLRKSLLQKVFANDNEETPELRFNRFQDSWNQKKLGSLFTESKHKSENGQLLSVSITRGVYPFDPTERKNNSSTNKANYKFVEKNDIAYNSMRMWQGAEGVSHYSGIVSPAYTVLHPKETTNPEFFAYMFKRADMLNKFRRYSQGLTSDTWNLKFPVLKTISVKTTNLQEQEKIVKLFKTLEDNSNLQRQKLERYKQLKKFLLQQMFI